MSPDDDQVISEMVKQAEETIQTALQRFPDDEFLLDAEAKLAELIGASEKAIVALKKAYERNSMSPHISRGLSRLYENKGEYSIARDVLEKCLDGLPTNKAVNAALARLLTNYFPQDGEKAEFHWRRSFTEGDTRYDSQFWYARQLWINEKKNEARKHFEQLRSARISSETKWKVRGTILDSSGNPIKYVGRIVKIEYSYAFISQEFSDEWIFLHRTNADREIWDKLERMSSVSYQLGFTYKGLAAYQVSIMGD